MHVYIHFCVYVYVSVCIYVYIFFFVFCLSKHKILMPDYATDVSGFEMF